MWPNPKKDRGTNLESVNNKMSKTATDYPDPGMLEHLRELAAAEPFKAFNIRMVDGTKFAISTKEDIEFTHYGSPRIRSFANPSAHKRWYIINVEAIASISL